MLFKSLNNILRGLLAPKQNTSKLITVADKINSYQQYPSFSNLLPWREYHPQAKAFLLSDGRSVGALLELSPVSCEARPEAFLHQLAGQLQTMITDVVPHDKVSPWIIQLYAQDDATLAEDYTCLERYVLPALRHDPFTVHHLNVMKKHVDYMAHTQGLFIDDKVSGHVFRGRRKRVRLTLYRKVPAAQPKHFRRSALEELNRVAKRLQDKLQAIGITTRRCDGRDFYEWMLRWFNPAPAQTQGDVDALIRHCPYPGDKQQPFGWDFTEQCLYNAPESFSEGWYFDKQPHKVLTVQSLLSIPVIGHISAERQFGKKQYYALTDVLPIGSILVMTIIVQHTDISKQHLNGIYNSAIGLDANVKRTKQAINITSESIAKGDYIYPTLVNVYIKGENAQVLQQHESEVETLLNNNGLRIISQEHELMHVDAYLRYLPFCYDYQFDQSHTQRSRYIFSSHIAHLLPLYGRTRGTGHPGLYFFNRGGEGVTYDPYNKQDKQSNSHVVLLGSTGTGKSNLMCYTMAHQLATFNPRIVCIESGGSFDLFAEHVAAQGKTVNTVTIKPESPVSLNPFADGSRILDQLERLSQQQKITISEQVEDTIQQTKTYANEEDTRCNEERDLLGEMLLAAQLMVTGGEDKEEARFMRSDRMLLVDAIISGAKVAKAEQRQMIAQDVLHGLHQMIQQFDPKRDADQIKRSQEMANSMRYFCTDPLTASFFNTPGKPWPTTDFTLVNLGLFSGDGYEAQRAMAILGILNKVLALAEASRHLHRPIILYIDECHILLVYVLIAAMLTRIAKMARKLGIWLFMATQNVGDFKHGTRRILSMAEHWIVLSTDEEEVKAIDAFKGLSEEEKRLILSAQKMPGQYTEGCILGKTYRGLFRNIPPRLYLALAMTEKEEQAKRFEIMQREKLLQSEKTRKRAELKAAYVMADNLMKKRV